MNTGNSLGGDTFSGSNATVNRNVFNTTIRFDNWFIDFLLVSQVVLINARLQRLDQMHDPEELLKKVISKQPEMIKAELSVYVPLEYSRSVPSETSSTTRSALSHVMNGLLEGEGIQLEELKQGPQVRILLVQGAAGTGKSLFGWKLCQEYRQHGRQGVPVPLFLSLPMYKELLEDKVKRKSLMSEYFRRNFGMNKAQTKLLHDKAFVFVLDGLDELNNKFHLWTECELHLWSRSLFVISSRTGFLQADDVNSFLVPRAPDSTQKLYHQLIQLYLLPFSTEQCDEYVKQFAQGPDNVAGWRADEYQAARQKMPELKELGREPLTLFMILRILPRLSRHTKDSQRLDPNLLLVKPANEVEVPFLHIRRVELYAIFFDDWVDREVRRQLAPEGLAENSEDYKNKFHEMKNGVTGFSEALALQMFLHDVTSVEVTAEKWKQSQPELAAKMLARMSERERKAHLAKQRQQQKPVDKDAWAIELFFAKDETEAQRQQKRACSPLRKSGDRYAYLHKSLQEYFAALSIASELVLPDDDWLEVLRDPKRIQELKITKKLLTDDYAVLRFAAELVDQRVRRYVPSFQQQSQEQKSPSSSFQPFGKALLDLIEASRHLPLDQVETSQLNVAAANAISILNYANVPLAQRDFSRAQLGYLASSSSKASHAFADLNCAMLDGCKFQGANLAGARLQEASLDFADLRGCNLSDVILGRGRTLRGHTYCQESCAFC